MIYDNDFYVTVAPVQAAKPGSNQQRRGVRQTTYFRYCGLGVWPTAPNDTGPSDI